MAVVTTSFSAEGSEMILGAINAMAEAIGDAGFYGADLDYDDMTPAFEATVENLDLEGMLGWAAMFRTALRENDVEDLAFTLEGVADQDYGAYTAFEICCTEGVLTRKTFDFEVTTDKDADFDARQEALWDAEDDAKKALADVAAVPLADVDYDPDEYDAASEALADYLDEQD